MKRYTNERGDVAVLISPGYGAGWSTWADKYQQERMLFDPELVSIVLRWQRPLKDWEETRRISELKQYVEGNPNYEGVYLGGLGDLYVEWLKPGQKFIVHEYDGSESLFLLDEVEHFTA